MFHPPRIRRGVAAAIRTRRHGAARGAAAAFFFIIIYGVPRCGAAACFIRREPAVARPRDSYQAPRCGVRRGGGAFFILKKGRLSFKHMTGIIIYITI
jgi:hypothetical protein